MASEKSYADRVGRAELLQNTITGFAVAFVPSDTDNEIPNYQAFWQSCQTKNTTVDTLVENYSTLAAERLNHVKEMKKKATRVLNYVQSVKALKDYWTTTKRSVHRITQFMPTKAKPPAEGEPEPEKKKRNKGELSFADIANNYKTLNSLLISMGGTYTPSADLTTASLTANITTLETQNTNIGTLDGQISVGRKERKEMFDGENGLKERMLSLKKNVFSQYGGDSAEYQSVKGIKV